MMGYRAWFARVRAAIDLPVIDQLLYQMNVSRFIVTRMAREHVYSDPTWLSGGRLSAKLAVTRDRGATRFGPVCQRVLGSDRKPRELSRLGRERG
jgi:hypothetical protein